MPSLWCGEGARTGLLGGDGLRSLLQPTHPVRHVLREGSSVSRKPTDSARLNTPAKQRFEEIRRAEIRRLSQRTPAAAGWHSPPRSSRGRPPSAARGGCSCVCCRRCRRCHVDGKATGVLRWGAARRGAGGGPSRPLPPLRPQLRHLPPPPPAAAGLGWIRRRRPGLRGGRGEGAAGPAPGRRSRAAAARRRQGPSATWSLRSRRRPAGACHSRGRRGRRGLRGRRGGGDGGASGGARHVAGSGGGGAWGWYRSRSRPAGTWRPGAAAAAPARCWPCWPPPVTSCIWSKKVAGWKSGRCKGS